MIALAVVLIVLGLIFAPILLWIGVLILVVGLLYEFVGVRGRGGRRYY